MKYATGCDSNGIEAVSLYIPKFSASKREGRRNINAYHVLFVLAYFYQAYWCFRTAGKPYEKFLLKAETEGFTVIEGLTQHRAELHHALSDISDPNRPPEKTGWFDWMDSDIEELAARKKREKERNVLDSLPKGQRVPGRYTPEFVPMLVWGILVTAHLLVGLLQVWLVGFKVWVGYREVDVRDVVVPEEILDLEAREEVVRKQWEEDRRAGKAIDGDDNEGGGDTLGEIVYNHALTQTLPDHLPTHARIVPAPTKGSSTSTSNATTTTQPKPKHILVPLLYLPTLGLTFEHHRRRYVYSPTDQQWTKIRPSTTLPTTFFSTWPGFTLRSQLHASSLRHGPNKFAVRRPSFRELYRQQLLSPFTVFQLFCVVLWMLDEYWQYSFFTLFMILVFEATVVFSRIKSLGALTGMGNKSRGIWCWRMGGWSVVESWELMPGDVISLTKGGGGGGSRTSDEEEKKQDQTNKKKDKNQSEEKATVVGVLASRETDEGLDIVPADLLLLRGSVVVNEASLTGESLPQIKEGMGFDSSKKNSADGDDDNDDEEVERLDMKNHHKTHVLYAGTKMLLCKGLDTSDTQGNGTNTETNDEDDEGSESESDTESPLTCDKIPPPPDNGCLCFVLRTGFSSAQGKLVRMIEGSQEKVKGHERETGLLLLMLFIFAVASSSYVLYHGLQNENRSQYELLLHCILIVTSVIPPELPMQMAMAVNNSLMTLMKMQVFCTEPYRVPIAGKLDSCLFDKTGTLTTDELVAVGVCGAKAVSEDQPRPTKSSMAMTTETTNKKNEVELTPMSKLVSESTAALVLAGCHSLVLIDGAVTGDPLENAALTAMRWGIDPKTGHAAPLPATEKKSAGKPLIIPRPNGNGTTTVTAVEGLARHHFSSKLQRMSCVVRVTGTGAYYAVAKGSSEAIGALLESKPKGYDSTSRRLAKRGYRVISLAYRVLLGGRDEVERAKESRAASEEGLVFAGFVAFTCRVRKDTKFVLGRLMEGGMGVTMVTGDALLTAAHVAKEVGICDGGVSDGLENVLKDGLVVGEGKLEKNKDLIQYIMDRRTEIEQQGDKIGANQSIFKRFEKPKVRKTILLLEQDNDTKSLFWQSYDDDARVQDYDPATVKDLASRHDLATTGKNLTAAFSYHIGTRAVLRYFKIFARMTPDAKETVIECLHEAGLLCLMCGDGANDVGALKQSDVGVALLSGFGDVNVDKGEDGNDIKKDDVTEAEKVAKDPRMAKVLAPDHLQALKLLPAALIKARIRGELKVEPDDYADTLNTKEDLVKLYEIKSREKAVVMYNKKRLQTKVNLSKSEMKNKQRMDMEEKKNRMLARTKELQDQGVQWAQFKAMKEFYASEQEGSKARKMKMKKVSGVEGQAAAMVAQFDDLELDEIPMVKLGDASIAAPFTSKMPSIRSCVDIIRQGRCTLVTSMQMYQILALNCLISSYSLSVLYLDGIKYGDTQMTAMGILGSISYMSVSRSKPLANLSAVKPLGSIFHPSMFLSLLGQFAVHLVVMMLAVRVAKEHLTEDYKVDLDGVFSPGILNSVVFLVNNVQQVTVFVVNLQGRPFMTGLTENRPLLWSLVATFILTFMFASESVPSLNRYFQLVPFPDENFRDYILKLLVLDVVASFSFDRLMKFIFSPEILYASMKGTTAKDVIGLAKTIGCVFAVMYMFLGNNETWDLLIEEQAAYEAEEAGLVEGALDAINSTDVIDYMTEEL